MRKYMNELKFQWIFAVTILNFSKESYTKTRQFKTIAFIKKIFNFSPLSTQGKVGKYQIKK